MALFVLNLLYAVLVIADLGDPYDPPTGWLVVSGLAFMLPIAGITLLLIALPGQDLSVDDSGVVLLSVILYVVALVLGGLQWYKLISDKIFYVRARKAPPWQPRQTRRALKNIREIKSGKRS